MSELPKRKSIRLAAENYADGGYFHITICIQGRKCILGQIIDGKMQLSELGALILEEIKAIPLHHAQTKIIGAVIMPDHVHFIMQYHGEKVHFGKVVGSMKASVTRKIGYSIWQRNYFERAIRTEQEMWDKLRYMQDNPLRWELKRKGLMM